VPFGTGDCWLAGEQNLKGVAESTFVLHVLRSDFGE
jgi:hypothetical protein